MSIPPVETRASSEILPANLDIKEMTPVSVMEETIEEVPTPAVVQPPHTSPKPSFAGEVRLHSR